MTRTLTSTSGFSSMTDNIGSLRNQGFEFAITSRNLTGKLSWTTSLNFTHEKNEILELTKTTDGEWMEVAAGWNQVRAVGHNINSYYLLVADGIYQNKEEIPTTLWNEGVRPGDVRYIDKNNDGYITEADRFILRSPEPKLYGGFDNYFSYKDFDLSISTYFSLGGKVYAMWAAEDGCANLGRSLTSITKDVADDRWTGEGTSNSVPRAIYGTQGTWNTQNSTRFYEDVSFLKVKDITLGYSLPKSLVNRLGMQKLRVYVKAQNLLTFTNYSGYDPEVLSASTSTVVGADQGTQPQPRSFLFGLNITL